MIRLILLLALLMSSISAYGAEGAQPLNMVYGSGAATCEQWTRQHHEDGADQWLLGWVSAASVYYGKISKTESDAMIAHVSSYCRKNPLDGIEVAAHNLVEELAKRAK